MNQLLCHQNDDSSDSLMRAFEQRVEKILVLTVFVVLPCHLKKFYAIGKNSGLNGTRNLISVMPIFDPHNDLLSVGLTAQLEEDCAGITEVRVRVPFRPEFFRPLLRDCSSSKVKM